MAKYHHKRKYKQGVYTPINENKFVRSSSSLEKEQIIYRSSWEKKFMHWADNNPSVIKIASEPYPIKYYFELDGKYHRYYIDFLIRVKDQNNKIKDYLIEIKPFSEYKDVIEGVKKRGKMKESTFLRRLRTAIKNKAKWEAAKKFAEKRNLKFKVLTEKELFS